jgi:hypothetical protein
VITRSVNVTDDSWRLREEIQAQADFVSLVSTIRVHYPDRWEKAHDEAMRGAELADGTLSFKMPLRRLRNIADTWDKRRG